MVNVFSSKSLLLSLEREGYINSVVEITVESINKTSVLVKFEVNKGEPITITKIKYPFPIFCIQFIDFVSNR